MNNKNVNKSKIGGKKRKYSLKSPLEAYTRTIIEKRLELLGYNMDERDENCNVYRERAKYQYQDDLLNGKNPDFLIYQSGTSRILAVIEAKRPSKSLKEALEQAIDLYANPLDIPIVFIFNAGAFYACTKNRIPVKIDNIEISDFVNEQTLTLLINGNGKIESVPSGFTITKSDLLKKFKSANNLLRKAGLRDGYERFSVFSDLMFLKLKDDFSDIGEDLFNDKAIDRICNWQKLMSKMPDKSGKHYTVEDSEVKSYLEDTIKTKLKKAYGDIFETSLNIKDESILIDLIQEIDEIPFKNIESDVKGDAFEFFLRNVTNGNKDLGEYYIPRHIVKMIVKFLNPIYGETVYDPCCGTGGFLLECFRYLREHTNTTIFDGDSDEIINEKKEKKEFIKKKSIYGREITSTARIAKMNMILFGDGHTNIEQMDCLSKVVNEKYDIVVSNIPYSQKVEHGALYEFPTDKGDSLFMQHIWKSVKRGGRIAVVVPDTFLYSNDTFNVRKKIVDESSKMIIVSLPRGVFNPYTPTKTSVIIATKKTCPAQECAETSMYVIRNDGFELGARRRPLSGLSDCNKFLMDYNSDKTLRQFGAPNSIDVELAEIKESGYNLFPFCYMEHLPETKNVKSLNKIGEYIGIRDEMFVYDNFEDKEQECVILSVTKNGIYTGEVCTVEELNNLSQKYKRVYKGDFTYNPHRINVGSVGIVPPLAEYMFVSNIYPVFYIKDRHNIPGYYLLKKLKSEEYKTIINDYCLGGARADLKIEQLSKIKIENPSENDRKKISKLASEMECAYQKYLEIYKELME